jgi:hypothetical protein
MNFQYRTAAPLRPSFTKNALLSEQNFFEEHALRCVLDIILARSYPPQKMSPKNECFSLWGDEYTSCQPANRKKIMLFSFGHGRLSPP